LVLFHYALQEALPLYFTFTDYNATVLELVTLPNLLLVYKSLQPSFPNSPNPLADLNLDSHGDLDITPDLIKSFIDALHVTDLQLTFISGSWTPTSPFLSLIPTSRDMNTFVLASETIYSPAALANFTAALVGILREVRLGKAVVAAKRIYFGVGGSVDAFKIECAQRGAVAAEVENHGVDLGEGGVRRCLLEVQML
jgi:protein-histidine N-methyltransferase